MKLILFLFLTFLSSNVASAQMSFGFSYDCKENETTIVRIFKNSPAEKSGILVGDVLQSVGGVSIIGLNLNQVVKVFSESKDSSVIVVKRNGTVTKELTLVKQDKMNFLNKCYSGDCHNGKGVFVDNSGNEYHGNFINGATTGFGKMYYSNGSIYTGNFLEGKPFGNGNQIFKDGSYYEGNYLNGFFNGKGVYKSGNGDTFTGDFKNGLRGDPVLFYNKSTNETFLESYKNGVLASSTIVEKDGVLKAVSTAKEKVLDDFYNTKKAEIISLGENAKDKKLYKDRLELYKQTLAMQKKLTQYLTDGLVGNDLTENAKSRYKQVIAKEQLEILQIENLIKISTEAAKYDK